MEDDKTNNLSHVIVRGSASGFAQEIQIGSHRLTGDEPVSFGGTDTGPSPYDLLLAALGSWVMGILYEKSILILVIFSVILQLLSLLPFVFAKRSE